MAEAIVISENTSFQAENALLDVRIKLIVPDNLSLRKNLDKGLVRRNKGNPIMYSELYICTKRLGTESRVDHGL